MEPAALNMKCWTEWVAFFMPNKRYAFIQCCFNDGTASQTLGQHWSSTGWMSAVGCKVEWNARPCCLSRDLPPPLPSPPPPSRVHASSEFRHGCMVVFTVRHGAWRHDTCRNLACLPRYRCLVFASVPVIIMHSIIKATQSIFLFCLLYMSLICQHGHRLELRKFPQL